MCREATVVGSLDVPPFAFTSRVTLVGFMRGNECVCHEGSVDAYEKRQILGRIGPTGV
jgi:hypothetical protein